jgi:hypothetical protein
MTPYPIARVAGAIVGVLLAVGAVGAQTAATPSVKAGTPELNAQSRQDAVHARPQQLIRRAVARPSPDFTTYVEGELVRVSIPSNWRELPGANAVTFAPEGAYGNVGVKSVFTHGVGMGLARNDKHDLRATTDDFIDSYVLPSPTAGRTFRYRNVTIGDRLGLQTVLSSVSEATGEPERIEMFTTLLRDGALFYVLAVAPRQHAWGYASTFRRVVQSIEIMDCDRHATADTDGAAVTIPLCSENTRSVTR